MRRLLAVLVCCLAVNALGGEVFDQKPLAEGFVSSVDPYLRSVTIDGGLLTIDITSAVVRDAFFQEISPTNLRPGLHVATVIRPGDYRPGDPLSASVIQILQQPVGTMTGRIESVDPGTSSFVVLGQRIFTTPQTQFRGSVPEHDPHALGEMKAGDNVTVFLDGSPFILRAQSIYTLPPTFADTNIVFTSTLRKIDGNTWTVRAVKVGDRTVTGFKVVSGTSIDYFVRPGAVIDVFARIDGDEITAETIETGRIQQCPNFEPFPIITFEGTVTAISPVSITVVDEHGNSTTITLNDDTIYGVNDPKVGDRVAVTAEKHGDVFIARRVDPGHQSTLPPQ